MSDYTFLVKKCEWCGEDFANESNQYPHQFNAKKFCSSACLSSFRSSFAKEHASKIPKQPRKDYTSLTKPCKYCGKLIKNEKNLATYNFNSSSSYCSYECRIAFQSEFAKKLNLNIQHKKRNPPSDYSHLSKECPVCGKTFYNEKNLFPSAFKNKKYCSASCCNKSMSQRMKENNPMQNEDSVIKMMETTAARRKSGEIVPPQMSEKAREKMSKMMKKNNPNAGGITSRPRFFKKLKEEGIENLTLLTTDYDEYYIKGGRWKCEKCGNVFESVPAKFTGYIRCPYCNDSRGAVEKEIADWISGYETPMYCDRAIIPPLELDIVIPSKKIAIEVNEVVWHSEINSVSYDFLRGKDYHINKTIRCKEKGYSLLHVMDIEWVEKKEIVKSLILSKLGIFEKRLFARKCQVKEVGKKEANAFVEKNHIQGKSFSLTTNLGLFFEGELVCVIMVGSSRFKKDQKEIVRFCNKKNTQVVGGLSKLWKSYLKNFYKEGDKVVSYSDLRYFEGTSLEKIGFKYSHNSSPSYKYWKLGYPEKLYNRMGFQKHKLEERLENFDPKLTEWENMKKNKYNRIWDCGNAVYFYEG